MGADSCAFQPLTRRWWSDRALEYIGARRQSRQGARLCGTDTPEPFLLLRDFSDSGPVMGFSLFPKILFLEALMTLGRFP